MQLLIQELRLSPRYIIVHYTKAGLRQPKEDQRISYGLARGPHVGIHKVQEGQFTACCLNSDELQFLDICCSQEIAILCSADRLWLYCIAETVRVTGGSMRPADCMLASPALKDTIYVN